jgi:hypothetical protein
MIFTVTGENLTKIIKFVEGKLSAKVVGAEDDTLTISTKQGDRLFQALAEAAESNPSVKVTNMIQSQETLEDIFLKLAKITAAQPKLREA